MIHRRAMITGLVSLIAAPAIVRAGSIMPVKHMWVDTWKQGAFPVRDAAPVLGDIRLVRPEEFAWQVFDGAQWRDYGFYRDVLYHVALDRGQAGAASRPITTPRQIRT